MTWPGVLGRALVVMAVTTVLSLAAWTALPLAWGWQAYTVTSGSMAPLVRPGDVVVASPEIDPDHLVGSVVVIAPAAAGHEPVTHRVVERLPDGRFRTRGDANPQADSRLVTADELIGSGRVVVPLAGLVRLHAGRVLPAAAGLALIAFFLLRRRKPTSGNRPKPTSGNRPKPTGGDRPKPAGGNRPKPTGGNRPKSTSDDPAGPTGNGNSQREPAEEKASDKTAARPRAAARWNAPQRKPRTAGPGRRAMVVTAVVLLAVGSALRDTAAAFTAKSPTQTNTWKSSYFYTAAVKKSLPVSYWRMGGTSTAAVADEMGRNALALYNTPTVGAAGALTVDPDKATTFKNGTGPSYGSITNAAYAISGPVSVAAWTNAKASTNWRLVFKGEAQTGRLNYLLSWSSDKGGADMRFLVDAGGTRYETRGAWPADLGWHFVVGVYDGSFIRIYIDGVETGKLAATGTLAALPATPLQVSENNASTGLSGSVDEVAVWDSALSAAQIAQFYALAKQ
ncbi:signal peptidase I [Symbioplanes lichenis]|uniref:signal peptidase I n=1 Tax=Symbioplanes lichenis TaxID=1629072 RepID=UPI0027399C8B|nr:signal peptidase I [Actinoplanes lichenis]